MEDISALNKILFNASTEQELRDKSPDIFELINSENEFNSSDRVSFLPLPRLNSFSERRECHEIISNVIESGCFTSGPFTALVEDKLCNYYGASSCIATGSGTDALKIALKTVGVCAGDEVIIPLNSFAATENAVMAIGAVPVLANIDASYNMIPTEIDRLITPRTRAVLPVCLYGSTQNICTVFRKAQQAGIATVVDAAQCFGIKSVIDSCDILTLSFNPFKNIGSFGKSGAVLTRSTKHSQIARQYSYHGFAEGKKNIKIQDWGLNSRMDNMQAATLMIKFRHFQKNSAKRCYLAARYYLLLQGLKSHINLPTEKIENTWHLFPVNIRNSKRRELISFASERGVEFDIYYPVLSHCGEHDFAKNYSHREQFRASEEIHSSLLHIPLHNHMSFEEQNRVIGVFHDFF